MDKAYLKKYNLTESQRRFQRILEYTVGAGGTLEEAGPNDGGMPPMGGDPNAGGMPPMGGGAPQGGDPSMGGGMPPMGGDPNAGGAPQGGDPSMGGDPNADGAPQDGVEGFAPQGGDPSMGGDPNADGMPPVDGDPNAMGGEPTTESELGEDDEVINVDDLVDSQDKTKARIVHLDKKIDALLKTIEKLEGDIDRNNEHISELQGEFEKRNPTQVEKMTLRAQKGYPFSETPDNYWDKKEAEGDYSREDDNNGIDDQRYQITQNDVNNITDFDSIYKSITNGDFHQDLRDILNF